MSHSILYLQREAPEAPNGTYRINIAHSVEAAAVLANQAHAKGHGFVIFDRVDGLGDKRISVRLDNIAYIDAR